MNTAIYQVATKSGIQYPIRCGKFYTSDGFMMFDDDLGTVAVLPVNEIVSIFRDKEE